MFARSKLRVFMAVNCPQCNQSVESDFGMAQCPSCEAVFYIDFEGNVSTDVNSTSDSEPSMPVGAEGAKTSLEESLWEASNPEESSLPESGDLQATESQEQAWAGDWGAAQEEPVTSEELFQQETFQEELVEEVAQEEEQNAAWNDSWGGEPEEASVYGESNEEEAEAMTADEHLQEIQEYANSEASAGREGMLFYELQLQGVDTGEDLQILRSILGEKRLMLGVEEILAKRKDGELIISGLNPIKASVIVQELRIHGIEVRWRQYAIHE